LSRQRASFVKYGLVLLWLCFGPVIANAAHHPGLVANPQSVPYPWQSAMALWLVLGIESAVFFLILRRGRRFPLAFGLAVLLLAGSSMMTWTDMPGLYYVPLQFHLCLTILIGAAWTVRPIPSKPGPS